MHEAEVDADRAAIQAATAELLAALAVWSDDGILMPPHHAAVRGRAELQRYFRELFSRTAFKFSFTSSDIRLAGDLAFERLTYTALSWPALGGPPVEDEGKGVHVYRRQTDGSWKLALDIWNSDRPLARP